MKQYDIKYETFDGDCRMASIMGYDKQHAIGQLRNCKIVYWIKEQVK